MKQFDYEKLDVFKISIEFLIVSEEIVKIIPIGRSYLINQLQRSGLSIVLNIAEGAGEFSKNDKARFYRIARRSATECAAILDVCEALKLCDSEIIRKGRELLIRIISMLVKMIKR